MHPPKVQQGLGMFSSSQHLGWSPEDTFLSFIQEEAKDYFPTHFVACEFENPEGKRKENLHLGSKASCEPWREMMEGPGAQASHSCAASQPVAS